MSKRTGLDTQIVVEAAARLADQVGLEQLTLAQLAQELGIRTPSLYNHIDGLEGLRQKLYFHISQKFLELLKDTLINRTGEQAVYAIADNYRAFAHEHRGLYSLVNSLVDFGDEDLQKIKRTTTRIIGEVLSYLIEGEEELVPLIRAFRSLMHGFVSLELQGEFQMPVDIDMSYHWLINHFLHGFDS